MFVWIGLDCFFPTLHVYLLSFYTPFITISRQSSCIGTMRHCCRTSFGLNIPRGQRKCCITTRICVCIVRLPRGNRFTFILRICGLFSWNFNILDTCICSYSFNVLPLFGISVKLLDDLPICLLPWAFQLGQTASYIRIMSDTELVNMWVKQHHKWMSEPCSFWKGSTLVGKYFSPSHWVLGLRRDQKKSKTVKMPKKRG